MSSYARRESTKLKGRSRSSLCGPSSQPISNARLNTRPPPSHRRGRGPGASPYAPRPSVRTTGPKHNCERRSRFRRRSRGVSDLVAAILIVAIGVVLAAVLFALVSGLTSGPTTPPLGANFAWGQENNVTGSTISGCGASGGATHAFCYTVAISVSSVSTSNFVIVLRNLTGTPAVLPTGVTVSIDLISPVVSSAGCVAPGTPAPGCVAYASAGFGSAWTNQGSFFGSVTSGFTLVIFSTGTATSNGGMFGLVVSAVGTSGYSGNVIANAFP
jgi:hypothetical protein